MVDAGFGRVEPTDHGSRQDGAITRQRWSWRWPGTRANRLLLILFVELQLADILSTNYALAMPGVWEANPLMALSQAKLGALWWLPKVVVIGLIAVTAPFSRRRWPVVAMILLTTTAVVLNLAHL